LKDDEKRTENEDMFKEQKPYEKTNNFASSWALSGTLQELIETSKQVNTTWWYSWDSESWENYWKAPFKDTSEYPNKNVKDEEYKPIDDNKVWTLYSNTGAKEELKKIQYYSVNDNNQYKPIELAKNISGTYLSMDEKDEGWTWTYFTSKNGADKSVECKDSFCIDKTEMKYNFENEYFWWDDFFRWGQTRDMSIEDLIIRSNDHLQKFTNTSLVQAKMTINNFELWLKDIDLQEMFHLWFQIVKKPVPILDLTYETQKNNSGRLVNGSWANISEFELNKQLEFYYNIYWLDYNRRNDLSILTDVVYDKQMALNSTELSAIWTPNGYMSKFIGYSQYSKRLAEQREIFWEIIWNEATFWMLGNLERQFRELEIYHRTIKDYIVDLKSLIINLLKIPIDTSQT
jgi:hypothetical protein